jgi:hypothetical protein
MSSTQRSGSASRVASSLSPRRRLAINPSVESRPAFAVRDSHADRFHPLSLRSANNGVWRHLEPVLAQVGNVHYRTLFLPKGIKAYAAKLLRSSLATGVV